MKILLLATFITLFSCHEELSINSPLDNSKWKVFKTTHEFVDGTSKSYTDDVDGGYYITFKRNKTYEMSTYPYSATWTGKWSYSAIDKKLVLDNNEIDVISLTNDRLVLYNENAGVNKDGFINVTTELKPI
jgi:hypothetical protein